ncbi:hypothetical protein DIPPA_20642 [Diplonema papillatum]|nr:hypothetical protein DIPPA_20642 [Diplonema papillatum]
MGYRLATGNGGSGQVSLLSLRDLQTGIGGAGYGVAEDSLSSGSCDDDDAPLGANPAQQAFRLPGSSLGGVPGCFAASGGSRGKPRGALCPEANGGLGSPYHSYRSKSTVPNSPVSSSIAYDTTASGLTSKQPESPTSPVSFTRYNNNYKYKQAHAVSPVSPSTHAATRHPKPPLSPAAQYLHTGNGHMPKHPISPVSSTIPPAMAAGDLMSRQPKSPATSREPYFNTCGNSHMAKHPISPVSPGIPSAMAASDFISRQPKSPAAAREPYFNPCGSGHKSSGTTSALAASDFMSRQPKSPAASREAPFHTTGSPTIAQPVSPATPPFAQSHQSRYPGSPTCPSQVRFPPAAATQELCSRSCSAASSQTPPGATKAADYARRIRALYQAYDPDKLPTVAASIAWYKGSEEALLDALVSRYGAEPSADNRGLLAGWREVENSEGDVFYVNPAGKTRWVRPVS